VWGYGNVMREYRITRANPPVIHDPSGEFASAPALRDAVGRNA
jgi:hypothetical protein